MCSAYKALSEPIALEMYEAMASNETVVYTNPWGLR